MTYVSYFVEHKQHYNQTNQVNGHGRNYASVEGELCASPTIDWRIAGDVKL